MPAVFFLVSLFFSGLSQSVVLPLPTLHFLHRIISSNNELQEKSEPSTLVLFIRKVQTYFRKVS